MKPYFDHIYKVTCPCDIYDSSGNSLYYRGDNGKTFLVPLADQIFLKRGKAEFVGIDPNFYNVTPPPLPAGWEVSIKKGSEPKKASITVSYNKKKAVVRLDENIFNDPEVLEGSKVFMLFHEIGHLIFGSEEHKCDTFAFYHSLRAGVSPFVIYATLRAYMPGHYDYRIIEMGNNLLSNQHLKNDI